MIAATVLLSFVAGILFAMAVYEVKELQILKKEYEAKRRYLEKLSKIPSEAWRPDPWISETTIIKTSYSEDLDEDESSSYDDREG